MPEDNIIIEEESLDSETLHTEHAGEATVVPFAESSSAPAPESSRGEPGGTEPNQAEPVRTEPVRTEPVQSEPVRTTPSQSENFRTEIPTSEPPHFEFNRTEAPSPEPPEMVIEKAPRHFFPFRRQDVEFSRDKWILTHINSDDLMEYLKLEQERSEQLRKAREIRGKRLMAAFQLTVSLAAIVAVIYLLRDVPTILVNILYIVGIIAALWLWKNPRDPDKK